MKKLDILKLILAGVSVAVPAVGAVAAGVEGLIKRDDDPTNDVDETANALGDIVVNSVLAIEQVTGKDLANDAYLRLLAEDIRIDIRRYQQHLRDLNIRPSGSVVA